MRTEHLVRGHVHYDDASLHRHRPRSRVDASVAFLRDQRAGAGDVVRIENAHRNLLRDGGSDCARMQNFRAEPRQLGGLDIRNAIDHARAGDQARIAGHHAIDIRPDLNLICSDRCADDRRAVIGAATAERRGGAVSRAADKSADDRDEIALDERQQHAFRCSARFVHEWICFAKAGVSDHHFFGIDVLAGQCAHHHRIREQNRRQLFADRHHLVPRASGDLAEQRDSTKDRVDLIDLFVELLDE